MHVLFLQSEQGGSPLIKKRCTKRLVIFKWKEILKNACTDTNSEKYQLVKGYRQTLSPHSHELAQWPLLSIGEIQWPPIFYFIKKNCGKTHALYNTMPFGLKFFNLTIRYSTLWFWNLHWTYRHFNVTGYVQGYMPYVYTRLYQFYFYNFDHCYCSGLSGVTVKQVVLLFFYKM